MRILIADDDQVLNYIIAKRLENEGYCVDQCFDGEEALQYSSTGVFDVIVLDVMMPKKSGLDVVRHMRKSNNQTPVLLLSAKDHILDRVEGLDAGADDYMVKPFAFEELFARIRVMIRNRAGKSSNLIIVADLEMDLCSRVVRRGGTVIRLSSKEFDVLAYMILNQGIVLSREKIENHVWNFDYTGGTNIVDVYIRYLRKKIDDPFPEKLIHTVRNQGYVLKTADRIQKD